jgi:hypothetical protein
MLANDLALALDPALIMRRAGLVPDPWQAEVLRSSSHQHLLLCTRQGGKSTATAALAVWEAVYHAPALILLLSPSLRQSQELFKKVVEFYTALNRPVAAKEESALRLELANGSRIIALPGTSATIRGYSGVRLLIIDEAAQVDDALYLAVRPMLAVSGGKLVALSTPFGKRGFFFETFENGGAEWERHKVTAYDLAPRISREFLEEERRAMPPYFFDQEYLCKFTETIDQVFAYDLIMGAMSDRVKPLFTDDYWSNKT